MSGTPNRRRFLQASFAAGTVIAVGSASTTQGEHRAFEPHPWDVNPPARPGRVRWHDNFAAACTAAGRSGKPVFHFHMLGRLDEKFC